MSVIATTGLLMQLGLALASAEDLAAAERRRSLRQMPERVARCIDACEPQIQNWIEQLVQKECVALCGSGGNWGTVVEGAMKLAEAAGVTARYDTVLGLLVGPVMALDRRWLAVPLLTRLELQTGRQLLEVVRSIGAESLCIVEPGLHVEDLADRVLTLPDSVDPLLAPLTFLPPLQVLTYYWAVARGLNPDQPAQMRAILRALLPPGREEP
jgi:glucosamine--fructose-6-phosphate aminotransferase (isomerizing)